jgi:hypothetical protein
MRSLSVYVLVVLVAASALACGDDPVAYSETVSVKLSGIKNGDIQNQSASEDKNINTESGNPYAEFLKNARAKLGGRDPGYIEVASAFVRVHSDSKNVIAFEQVFTDLELFLANSQTTIPAGTRTSPTGTSVQMKVPDDLDYEPVAASMRSGDFKVGVRGGTVATPPVDFDMKLTIDLKFTAYE